MNLEKIEPFWGSKSAIDILVALVLFVIPNSVPCFHCREEILFSVFKEKIILQFVQGYDVTHEPLSLLIVFLDKVNLDFIFIY